MPIHQPLLERSTTVRQSSAALAMNYQPHDAGREFRTRRCLSGSGVRDFGEEIGIAPRHGDVVERAHAPRGVAAHGHQKLFP